MQTFFLIHRLTEKLAVLLLQAVRFVTPVVIRTIHKAGFILRFRLWCQRELFLINKA